MPLSAAEEPVKEAPVQLGASKVETDSNSENDTESEGAPEVPQVLECTEHAIDYDGCAGNHMGEKHTPEELVALNKDFLDIIKLMSPSNGVSCVSIFTARQSQVHDEYCASKEVNDSTSCFEMYPEFAKYLGAEVDTCLLADIAAELPSNISFDRAIDPDYDGDHAHWYADESKITIAYLKMHRAANIYPNAHITINFYDDKGDEILSRLNEFYTENKDLIPANVKLVFWEYARAHESKGYEMVLEWLATLAGDDTSLGIDEGYRNTLVEMGKVVFNLPIDEIYELDLGRVARDARAPRPSIGPMIFHPASSAASADDELVESTASLNLGGK